MPQFYYSLGTTLANMTNIETTYGITPNSLQQNAVPFVAPNVERVASGRLVRSGKINLPLAFSALKQSELQDFVYGVWGDFTTASVDVFATVIDEYGFYSPFAVTLDRPTITDYRLVNNVWVQDVLINGFGWQFESTTKTADYTMTDSDRFVKVDATSGSVTITLPAANAVNANTVYSVQRIATDSNSVVVQRAGSDTLNGGTQLNVTGVNTRRQIISNGTSAWTTI